MASAEHKLLGKPVKVRRPEGETKLVDVGGGVRQKLALEPGWRWSETRQAHREHGVVRGPRLQFRVSGSCMS